MRRHVVLWLMPVVGAALLTSCRTPSAGITIESYPKTKITVNSKVVGGYLDVVECNVDKVNNLLQVQITVQNTTQKDCPFEYRFRWMTESGMSVDSGMSMWFPVSVSAKEKSLLKAIAPTKNANDFIFEVRFSRPNTRW